MHDHSPVVIVFLDPQIRFIIQGRVYIKPQYIFNLLRFALTGCWCTVSKWSIIYKSSHVCSLIALLLLLRGVGNLRLGPKPVNHTSWEAVVPLTDSHIGPNRCVLEHCGGVFLYVHFAILSFLLVIGIFFVSQISSFFSAILSHFFNLLFGVGSEVFANGFSKNNSCIVCSRCTSRWVGYILRPESTQKLMISDIKLYICNEYLWLVPVM